MTLTFEPTTTGYRVRNEIATKKTTIGHMTERPEGYEFVPAKKIELADGALDTIEAAFHAHLDALEPDDLSMPALPSLEVCPDPDPVHGTAGIEFMEHAAKYFPDDEFATLYENRWTFLNFRKESESATAFTARATKQFTK